MAQSPTLATERGSELALSGATIFFLSWFRATDLAFLARFPTSSRSPDSEFSANFAVRSRSLAQRIAFYSCCGALSESHWWFETTSCERLWSSGALDFASHLPTLVARYVLSLALSSFCPNLFTLAAFLTWLVEVPQSKIRQSVDFLPSLHKP